LDVPQAWQDTIDDAPITAQEFQEWGLWQLLAKAKTVVWDAAAAPLRLLAKLCCLLLAAALGKSFCAQDTSAGLAMLLDAVVGLAVFLLACGSALDTANTMQETVNTCWEYLVAFVPVFASVLTGCGQAGSAALYSGIFFSTANVIAGLLCRVGVPLTRIYLAFTAVSAMDDLLDTAALSRAIEKGVKWVLVLCTTLFSIVLGLQTAFAQSADSLALKAGKFVLSSSIPVVGRVVSDAMGSVLAGVKLLKGSVGFAAVAVLAAGFVPLIAQCVVQQAVFSFGSVVARAMGETKSSSVLRGLAVCMGLYLSMAVFFCLVVVASTVVMILLGNGG
jgi:stage III sporulation protein AE